MRKQKVGDARPRRRYGEASQTGRTQRCDTTSLTLSLALGYGSAAGFTDLTGPAYSWLLHGPATPAETAPVLFDLAPWHTFAADHAQGGSIFGSLQYTPAQAADLFAGLDYINIYTPNNPGGEIRGQLVVVPEPSVLALLALVGAGALGRLAWRRVSRN